MNKYLNILSLCGFLVLSGCSSTVPSSIPDWYSNKEILQKQTPDKYFGYGSGTSLLKQMAREKALLEAIVDLKTNSNNIVAYNISKEFADKHKYEGRELWTYYMVIISK